MSDVNNIWKSNEGGLPEEKLQAYLEGRLSPDEQREVEQWLANEGMESDAMDGLKQMEPADARLSVGKLNHILQRELASKKRKRKYIKPSQWAWVAVLVILMLGIVAYIAIRMAIKK